jgi:O-antigen/teichoic acid export membrane protein
MTTLNYILAKLIKFRFQLGWVILGQTFAFILGVIGIKLLTNVMGPENYGRLAIGMSIAGMTKMCVYGPISQSILRFFSICRQHNKLNEYFDIIKMLHINSAIVIILLTGILSGFVYVYFDITWALIVLGGGIFGIFSGINASFISFQNANKNRRNTALHQVGDYFARPALAIVLLLTFGVTGYYGLLGFILGTALVLISQARILRKYMNTQRYLSHANEGENTKKRYLHEFYNYSSPFAIFAIFGAISAYGDRWILQALNGESEVGVYTAILQIATAPIVLFVSIVSQFLVPILFEHTSNAGKNKGFTQSDRIIKLTITISSVFFILAILISYYFGEFIVRILTTTEFSQHHNILWLAVAGVALFNIGQLMVIKGLNAQQSRIYIIPKAVQALLFLGFSFWLCQLYGMQGVVMSLCIASSAYVFSVMLVNKRLTSIL